MKHPPYNTGKVQIGCRYTPPSKIEFSRDAERLQTALIGRPKRDVSASYFVSLVAAAAVLFLCLMVVTK